MFEFNHQEDRAMIAHNHDQSGRLVRLTAPVTLCCNNDRISLEAGDEFRLESWRPEGFITSGCISKFGVKCYGLLWFRDLDKLEEVIPLKTVAMWEENHCSLSNFLQTGDELTYELLVALYDKHRAITSSDDAIQLGDSTQFTARELEDLRFHSFLNCSNAWRYLGQCRKFPEELDRHYFVTELKSQDENQIILRNVLDHYHLVTDSIAGQKFEWYFADADGNRHNPLPDSSTIHYIDESGLEFVVKTYQKVQS